MREPRRLEIAAAVVASVLALVALDALWLGVIAKSFVEERLGHLMRAEPQWAAAGLFYLLYALGVFYFAVRPSLRGGRWQKAALDGALFGFVAYMTYDLTNLATLRGWSVEFALVDMAWGAFATSAAACAARAAVEAVR